MFSAPLWFSNCLKRTKTDRPPSFRPSLQPWGRMWRSKPGRRLAATRVLPRDFSGQASPVPEPGLLSLPFIAAVGADVPKVVGTCARASAAAVGALVIVDWAGGPWLHGVPWPSTAITISRPLAGFALPLLLWILVLGGDLYSSVLIS